MNVRVGDRVEFEMNAPEDLVEETAVVTSIPEYDHITVTVRLDRDGSEIEADPDWMVKLS
jgi:hypothetical protein